MIVCVSLEHHFLCTPDGAVYTRAGFTYEFWSRYLAVFEGVKVVARMVMCDHAPASCRRADGPNVVFKGVPDYRGPVGFISNARSTCKAIQQSVNPTDAVILRSPSLISNLVYATHIRNSNRPFGVEVVGDPHEVFSHTSSKHPLRLAFRSLFSRAQRLLCARANAVAYVTECSLQERYPASASAYQTHYSSIDLPPDAVRREPRDFSGHSGEWRLIHVGSMNTLYKGQDLILEAMRLCKRAGLVLKLDLVGEGQMQSAFRSLADELQLSTQVHFAGAIPAGRPVRDALDAADIFVFPSRTEGLPKAVIEAMARGLPVVASRVGGIPELLPDEALVHPESAEAIAEWLISKCTADSYSELDRLAARNHRKALEYSSAELRLRRIAMYQASRRVSDEVTLA